LLSLQGSPAFIYLAFEFGALGAKALQFLITLLESVPQLCQLVVCSPCFPKSDGLSLVYVYKDFSGLCQKTMGSP
jgi:hypothetical protein